MTRSTAFWALATLLTAAGVAPAAEPGGPAPNAAEGPALAVLTFESALKDDGLRGELLADLVSAGLSERFRLVERKALDKVLAEQALNLSGLVAAEQAVRAGKLTGARFLVAGRAFPLGEHVSVALRVISVETGRFKGLHFALPGAPAADEVAGRAVKELTEQLPRLQKELLAPVDAAPLPGPPLPGSGLTVAVLNFANLGQGDPTWDWLGKGLADLTIGSLASQDLRVVSREQMQEMVHELEIKKASKEPQGMARVLKATRCVHGTYRIEGGQAQLHATILNAEDGKQIHAAVSSGPADGVLQLHQKLCAELTDVLQGKQPGTLDPAKLPRWTESLRASQLLYQGIDHFDKGEYLAGWLLFRRALSQDPAYADAQYWAGRMMYYEQEYTQARVDLERFTVEHPRHPRAGDAVMEIINAAQLTALDADEVLNVLAYAGQLAPLAEVPNQFGTGNSSTVAVYAAGLAAQILFPQGRHREAFDRYAEALEHLPVEHPVYWIAWHEMFKLKVKLLKLTGQLLPMPAFPQNKALLWGLWGVHQHNRNGRVLPHFLSAEPVKSEPMPFAGIRPESDDPITQGFAVLSPEHKSVTFDFSQDPLVPLIAAVQSQRKTVRASIATCTHYLCAQPQQCLTDLDVEVRYRTDPDNEFDVRLEGDGATDLPALNASGVIRRSVHLAPRTRAAAVRLAIQSRNPVASATTSMAVLSWTVTAHFAPCDGAPGTLILKMPTDLAFYVSLDQEKPTSLEGFHRIEDLAPGKHTLLVRPDIWGNQGEGKGTIDIAPGEVVEVGLSALIEPRRRNEARALWQSKEISTPYELYRAGADLGDLSLGRSPGEVRVLQDRLGHWIVLWHFRRDLYMTMSADRGRTWSATTKLPPPINSAHDEHMPELMQDADGRYILAFRSDRNLAHAHTVYVCWSDDLVNFSAPVQVHAKPAEPFRVCQRSDGTYLAYINLLGDLSKGRHLSGQGSFRGADSWAVCVSKDLVNWSPPEPILPWCEALDIVAFEGKFLALSLAEQGTATKPCELHVRTSLDGVAFSQPTSVSVKYPTPRQANFPFHIRQIVCRQVEGQLFALTSGGRADGIVLVYDGNSAWRPHAVLTKSPLVPSWGDLLLDKDGIHYFGIPSLDTTNKRQIARQWELLGQPMFMSRQEFDKKIPPIDFSVHNVPPSAVEVRIIRRYPVSPSALRSAPGKGS